MGSHLPTAGSRGGGQLGMIVFLIAVILVAGVVIAEYWPWRPDAERRPDSRSSSVLTSSTGSDRNGPRNTSAEPRAVNATPANPPCRDVRGTPEPRARRAKPYHRVAERQVHKRSKISGHPMVVSGARQRLVVDRTTGGGPIQSHLTTARLGQTWRYFRLSPRREERIRAHGNRAPCFVPRRQPTTREHAWTKTKATRPARKCRSRASDLDARWVRTDSEIVSAALDRDIDCSAWPA